jgi:hypothetical protein
LLVYAATADSSAAVLTWTRAGVTGLANVADTGVGTPGEYLDDTTNVNVIATYVYTAELHGCISAPVNVNITVVPTPYLLSKHFDTVCSQSPYLYVPVVSTGAATKQRWSRAVATGISNAAASDTVGTISETLASTDLFRHTATYIYTMFTDPACPVTDSLKVAVDPRPGYPQIATHSPSVLCAGTMYQNFGTANEPPAGVNYAWTASNAIVWAQGLKHQYSLINFTNPGLATVYINATLPGFTCASKDSFTVNVGTSVSNKPEVIWFNGDFICLSNTEDSYQWGYDDVLTLDSTLLPYETNQNYTLATPDTAAKYYWVITTHEDCMQKSYFKAPTKVREVSAYLGDVTVYPNPASNYVNVELKNGVMGGKYTVDVVNMLGQKVAADKMMDNKATFDVSDYAAGVYFVDCYKDGVKFATVKFVRN